jgi:hypothetical protein
LNTTRAAARRHSISVTWNLSSLFATRHLLTQPNKVLKPEDKLSADQWFAEHEELHDTRVPPVILQRWNKAMATFVSMHPEFVNTSEARERIFAALRSMKLNVTPQAIDEVFQQLAKQGEVDTNKSVDGQAVRLFDLGTRTYAQP